MVLYEMLIEEDLKEKYSNLEFLDEYLILAEEITVKEGREIISVIEQMHQDTEKQIQGRFKKALDKLKNKYNTLIAKYNAKLKEARLYVAAGKKNSVIKRLMVKISNLKQSFSIAKHDLIQRFKNISKKTAKRVSNSKTMVKMKALGKKIPKLGKAGKIAAGVTLAGGAGLGAYAAYKKRKR